jgi:hypothetical protein
MQPHERVIAFDLVGLAAGDIENRRIAFGVRAEMDFGREAAARIGGCTRARTLDPLISAAVPLLI